MVYNDAVSLNKVIKTNQKNFSKKDCWQFVNYLDTGNITENTISEIKLIDLQKEKLPSRAKRKASRNNIIYSTVRPNQKHFGFINKVRKNLIVSTGFCVIEVDEELADPKYIYYFLTRNSIIESLQSIAEQSVSTYPAIKATDIEKIKVKLPNLPNQKKIASILSALDDKIELNNKINKNLEEMAQAIFKSWFVDFEPWGGEMPDDWEYGKLGNIIEIYDSKRIPLSNRQRSTMKKIYPYYGATKIMDYVEDYIFEGTYILLGEDGTVSDEKGYPILQYTTDKFWVNNHTHVLKGKNNFNENSLYMLLRNIKVTEIITGAVQLKINQSNLKSIKIVIPSKTVLLHYNSIIDPIFNKKLKNDLENNNLIQIRDTLLPKLMSGEVDVSKLEI